MNPEADEITQREKREVMRNDRLNTYAAHAAASLEDDRGGRYSATGKAATVVGSSPIAYPRLPKEAPANQAMRVPDEPSLGYSVESHEPVGEPHEVAESERAGATIQASGVRLRRRRI